MNKLTNITLVALAVAIGTSLPARASDSEEIAVKVVKVPVMVSALLAGMAVGTPIAVVHDTMKNFSSAREAVANEFTGGEQSADPIQSLVAGIVAAPAGLAVGLLDGTYHGFSNAISNCNEKPFSEESFCMKDSCYSD